jgi:magnesium transporter
MAGKRKRKKSGLPPGSLIYTGERKIANPNVTLLQYNESSLEEKQQVGEEVVLPEDGNVTWYDIRGLHEIGLVEKIGGIFDIHPLVQEDILNIHQRPKFEEHTNGFFIVFQALSFDGKKLVVQFEQVSLFVGKNFLISFQEDASDLFTAVRERLASGRGRIRMRGPDYLAYALVDSVVDNYYLILDDIEEAIEKMEADILEGRASDIKSRIHKLKREMIGLRKSVAPLREAVNRFARAEHELISQESVIFLRDLHDHMVQVMDTIETSRDTLTGMQDLYLSELSYRMNNVMQVLTIIATIFIPLTFLAGVYGMNFDNMPELHWKYGYFAVWAIMVVIALGLIRYFRTKRWL